MVIGPWWDDMGKVLFEDGDWILYIDYLIQYDPDGLPRRVRDDDRIVAISHQCNPPYKSRILPALSRCPTCHAPVPVEMEGLYNLVVWER